MVARERPCIAGLTIAFILLCHPPYYLMHNVQKLGAKLPPLPNHRITPFSSSDHLAAQSTKDSLTLKRTVRKLNQEGDAALLEEYQGVVGRPGVDFPVLSNIPATNFNCKNFKGSGYYADLDTNCQVFHICDGGQKTSFLCPNGTIFRQSHLICDWWFRVDCRNSVNLYAESAEQLAIDQKFYREKSQEKSKALENLEKNEAPKDIASSKVKASGNQPLQQNIYPSQNNRKVYSTKQRVSEETPSPNYYSEQTHTQFSGAGKFFANSLNPNLPLNTVSSTASSQMFSSGNSLDNESQVLAESANYRSQNLYNGGNYYSPDGSSKQYPSYEQENNQQKSNYPRPSTGEKNIQLSTTQTYGNYGTSPQQNVTFGAKISAQKSNQIKSQTNQINISQGPNIQQTNYPETNYPQTVTPQRSNTGLQSSFTQKGPQSANAQEPSKFTSANTISSYSPEGTTAQQASSYSQQSTFQQNGFYQGNMNIFQDSGNKYQGSTNQYEGSTNQYEGSRYQYQGSTTLNQGSTNFYQGNTNGPQTTMQPLETTYYQQKTAADLSKDFTSSRPLPSTVTYSPNIFSTYTYPSFVENSTPAYSTLTTRDYYPTTINSYNPTTISSNPTRTPELSSTLNFNGQSLSQSSLVPDPNNNALEETSNGDVGNHLNSISIYYDQINNKESVRLPSSNQDIRNKISVSDISLNQESQNPQTNFEHSNALTSVLTDSTKEGYSQLFPSRSLFNSVNSGGVQGLDDRINTGNNPAFPSYENDLSLQENQGLAQSSYSTPNPPTVRTPTPEDQKNLKLHHSADLRELAQVFSRALSAYLEDPDNFRRILSEVRPTEPNLKTTTTNSYKNEVLDFSEDIKFSPSKNSVSRPPFYTTGGSTSTTLGEQYKTPSVSNQLNNLATDNSNLPSSSNLYGGFQNNSSSYSTYAKPTNVFQGTTPVYNSASNLAQVTRDSSAPNVNFQTTPVTTSFSSGGLVAQELNNLVPSKSYGDDLNNIFSSDTYDYSFGNDAKKSSQIADTYSLESLVPYDSQSIVSKDNLLRLQDAQQRYYDNYNFGQDKFSKVSEASYPSFVSSTSYPSYFVSSTSNPSFVSSTPSISSNYYSLSDPNSFAQTYSTNGYVSTEVPAFYSSTVPYVTPTVVPLQNATMYKEAKELFGNLNETSASILMNMMQQAETNSTLRRLVLLLVSDKSSKKTAEGTRNKLLEALLQMPQRVPAYPPSSRTLSLKQARGVKVLKSRHLASEKSPAHNETSKVETTTMRTSTASSTTLATSTRTPTKTRPDPLLAENLSSDSDTRAVELLKSLYVLAAKWG